MSGLAPLGDGIPEVLRLMAVAAENARRKAEMQDLADRLMAEAAHRGWVAEYDRMWAEGVGAFDESKVEDPL